MVLTWVEDPGFFLPTCSIYSNWMIPNCVSRFKKIKSSIQKKVNLHLRGTLLLFPPPPIIYAYDSGFNSILQHFTVVHQVLHHIVAHKNQEETPSHGRCVVQNRGFEPQCSSTPTGHVSELIHTRTHVCLSSFARITATDIIFFP